MSTIEEARSRLSRAAEQLQGRIARELTRTALDAETQARLLARQRIKSRSGRLLRSIRGQATLQGGEGEIRLSAGRQGGEDLKYAAIQEYGGVIRPVRRKWLAIPVGAALTGAGVARHATPRELNLRFVKIDGARALLVRDNPGNRRKGAHSEILFVLRKRTQLREKGFMRDGFRAATSGLSGRLEAIAAAAFGGA